MSTGKSWVRRHAGRLVLYGIVVAALAWAAWAVRDYERQVDDARGKARERIEGR